MAPGLYGVDPIVYAQNVLRGFEQTSPHYACIEASGAIERFHGSAGAQAAE